MATAAQIAANRENAKKSTGPATPAGKSAAAGNALKFGLYARHDRPDPRHTTLDEHFRDSLLADLAPATAIEESLAAEILRASRQLERCAAAEADLVGEHGANTVIDARLPSIDRARVAA